MPARDFEGPALGIGEKLFHCLGIEGLANSIAQLHHSVLYIANLTRKQKMVGRREGQHIAGV
jgi:hypothetical protein